MEKLKLTDFAKNELKAKEMESIKGKGDGVKCSSSRKCNKNNDSVNLTLANMRAKNPQPSTPNPTPPSKLRDTTTVVRDTVIKDTTAIKKRP